MTKDEWLSRCAARFKERATFLSDEEAAEQAQMCFDAESDGEFYFSGAQDTHPEDCADAEMEEWVNDEEGSE